MRNRELFAIFALSVTALCSTPCHSVDDKQTCSISASTLEINIARLAVEADVIVVGATPTELHPVDILGNVREGVEGYRIEVERFIKGYPSSRHVKSVHIDASYLADRGWESPTVPQQSETGDRFLYFLTEKRASYTSFPRTKPYSPASWFVPATPENISLAEKSLPQAQVWGRESNGLIAGVRTLKQTYTPGEPVRLEIYIKNTSDHSILIPQQRLAVKDCYPFLELSGETEMEVQPGKYDKSWVFLEKPAGRGQMDALPPVNLQPNEVYMERINLDSWQWTSFHIVSPFRAGLSWKMHGGIVIKDILQGFRYSNEQMSAMWTGVLEIPEFDVTFAVNGSKSK